MSCSLSGRDRFQALSAPEQARFRSVSQHLIRHAVASAVPIVFGHPPRIGNKIESASGCVLRLRAGSFVVTAAHVLRGYKEWLTEGEESIWQVGRLKFSPLGRIASSDKSADVAFLKVSEGEASEVGSSILSPSNVWPPPPSGNRAAVDHIGVSESRAAISRPGGDRLLSYVRDPSRN